MGTFQITKCNNGAFKCSHLKGNDCAFVYGILKSLPANGVIPDSCPLNSDSDNFCAWHQEEEDSSHYESDCGFSFFFEDDGVNDNGFKFCPSCGKPVVEVEWSLSEDTP